MFARFAPRPVQTLTMAFALILFCAAGVRAAEIPSRVRTAVEREVWTTVFIETPVAASSAKTGALPKPAAIASAREKTLASLEGVGFHTGYQFSAIPWMTATVNAEGLARLEQSGAVNRIGLDRRVSAAMDESAALIGADVSVDRFNVTGEGVTVAVIDSGIDTDHPDLLDCVAAQKSFLNEGEIGVEIEDDSGHGTHIAGIITGDGNVAPRGIAPDCKLVVVRALDDPDGPDGNAYEVGGWLSDITAALDWLTAQKTAGVIDCNWVNMSLVFGESSDDSFYDCPCDSAASTLDAEYAAFVTALTAAHNAGLNVIAPSGNDGPDGATMRAPSCFNHVLAVGAVYDSSIASVPTLGGDFFACSEYNVEANDVTCFTSRNDCINFVAPGYSITSCDLNGTTGSYNGTSQAAAHMTGALAAIQSAGGGLSAGETLGYAYATATGTVDPLNGSIFYSTLHVDDAVEQASAWNASDMWMLYR